MRYYNLEIYANAAEIKEKAQVKLNDYYYGSEIGAVNVYVYSHKDNDVDFFIYRENGDTCSAVMAFNEKKTTFQSAYDNILDLLKSTFDIKRVKAEPEEITMQEVYDNMTEARRRDYTHPHRIKNTFPDWIWDFYTWHMNETKKYKFREIMVEDSTAGKSVIYDDSFVKEIDNIESHQNDSACAGNMVHYVISSGSEEAAADMTSVLASSLLKAGRIKSGRVGIVSEIDPEIYKGTSYIESLIENNFGGTMIFDLSTKFGMHHEEYTMAAKYIENLFKRYRNNCLFVFTYNTENPGFAYYLLPHLKKYAIPVMLKEGSGDRKAAVNYLKTLIKKSNYAKYAGQANTFLKKFPGDEFTQTDVLAAYEQFEPWCINENILKAYDYNVSEDFMLDRESGESSYEKLQKMIGLDSVKKQIDDVIAAGVVERERKKRKGKNYQASTMHMVFAGNPGTAKTTVAKLFAGITKEKGILKSGVFVECGGMDLNGHPHVIRSAFTAAKGGVLFIDEAYALWPDPIATLIQEMENHRDDVIVILAGYNESMEFFINLNEGLKSRIPYWIKFPDYSTEEMTEIFKLMLEERGFTATDDAIKEATYIFTKVRYAENFGNGRDVRNIVDRAAQNQAVRLMGTKKDSAKVKENELFLIKKEDITMVNEGLEKEREPGTAKKELAEMIGLDSVKAVIKKAIASYKMAKVCVEKGLTKEKPSMHMVFMGNPGTAKTTVARLFAEILKDEKVLPTSKFVEVGRADLVAPYVGQTAPRVKKMFKKARGGVLFIDEAYSLCDGSKGGYGDEAINTIVQEMENHRDDVIVVFAGYPEPMKEFLEKNPGMKSRIAFQVDFEDYTVEELCGITELMAKNKSLNITENAMEKLKESYEKVCGEDDYGNGRFVRKMLEESEMNVATRLFENEEAEITEELLSTIEACDIPDTETKVKKAKSKIGFVNGVA